MENISITTKSLIKHRRYLKAQEDNSFYGNRLRRKRRRKSKWRRNPETFARWRASFRPKLYVFYRVQGIREFKANPKIQVKLLLMPCLLVENTNTPYMIFEEECVLYAYIHKVEPREGKDWISVFGTVGRPIKTQRFTPLAPAAYSQRIGEILAKIPFPSYVHTIRAASGSEDTCNTENGISKLRFHRFHLRFWQANGKNYGIIDRMWDEREREITLDLPPVSETEIDEVKESYPFAAAATQPAKITKTASINPDAVAGLLDDFLNSKMARTPPWKF